MRRVLVAASALTGAMVVGARAEGPDVSQVLSLKPSQPGIVYDIPAKETWENCKLEVIKEPTRGWVVRDGRGLVVRRFSDTNGDNVVDMWSYMMNGQEVYRDIDTNFDGKTDQCRWYNAGGSRWGVDDDQNGAIDSWRMISAEEAAAEAVAACATGDYARLRRVMVNPEELSRLGVNAVSKNRILNLHADAGPRFQQLAQALTGAEFNRFEGHQPMTIPSIDAAAASDLMIYQNATIIADAGKETQWLRVPEVVKVGDSWKLSDVPGLIDPDKPLPSASVLIPTVERMVVKTDDGAAKGEAMIEEGEEIQKFVAELQKHDQELPADAQNAREMVKYHVKRSELCARVGSLSKKLANREHWYKQAADSLNAAVQTNEFAQGIDMLSQYAQQFSKTTWGKSLAAYFQYRAINAKYASDLAKPDNDHAKIQEGFLGQLQQFLTDYPQADDTADALLQLGNGMEFAGKEEQARTYYKKLVSDFPKSDSFAKAEGSVRRIEAQGQPFQLYGDSLTGNAKIDTARFKGRVVIVNYWATWCEPCKAEMPRLKKLYEKHHAQGLEIVGVCLDSDKVAGQNYVHQNQYAWPQIFEEGSLESAPAVRYGVISLPYLMLVDADGKVINKNLQYNSLEVEVEKALTQKLANREK